MAEKKVTKKEYFTQLKEIVKGNAELVSFIDHELELLDKKSSNKTPSKVQLENESIKDHILVVLTDLAKPATITDIQNASVKLADLSNQKITALLTQLVKSEKVVRTVDKKKAFYTII